MKITELIEKLQQYPQDIEVGISRRDGSAKYDLDIGIEDYDLKESHPVDIAPVVVLY